MKYFVLSALQEQQLSGYEIVQAIETKYGHAPSPAAVYPTLQLLEDQGYVKSSEQDNKRVYALTDDGKKYVEENRERFEQMAIRIGQPNWAALPGIGTRLASLAGTIFSNSSYLDDAKAKRLEELLDEMRKRVGDIIFENQAD